MQLLLAGMLLWLERRENTTFDSATLLEFDSDSVDKLVVEDANNELILQRSASGKWQLPTLHELPASPDKMRKILLDMKRLKTSWPVSTDSSGHERFEVSADKFQRHVKLYSGEEVIGEFYVGTSPGFRQSHVRLADSQNVYSMELNIFDLGVEANAWLDKNLIAPVEPILIEGIDYALRKEGGEWRLSDTDETQLNTDIIDDLTNALGNLQVTGLTTGNATDESGVAEESETELPDKMTIQVSSTEHQWTYEFSRSGETYQVKRDDLQHQFLITRSDYEAIAAGNTRQKLLKDSGSEENEQMASEPEQPDMEPSAPMILAPESP